MSESKQGRMNKEVKKIWLDALKSGKYKQSKGRLRRGDGYCCLGVLCDLSIIHHHNTSRWADMEEKNVLGGKEFKFADEGQGMAGMPPYEVKRWAGLTTTDTLNLSALNDSTPENGNFVEVIKRIESTL